MSDDSEFVRHIPCPNCGSSDANGLYTDGHTFCHKCETWAPGEGDATPTTTRKPVSKDLIPLDRIEHVDLTKRKLNAETCRKWGYGVSLFKGQTVQVATYRDKEGKPVGQKVRFANKEFVYLGDMKAGGLYGQHLWRDGGKMVVVTEGEIDALSVSQVQDNKWPVVSVPNGAAGAAKAIKRELEWLERFDSVVLMFDNDDDGKAAALECVELFTPGKAKIATLPMKDANDCLKAGKAKDIIDAMWGAKAYRPDGVVSGTEVWDRLTNRAKVQSYEFPYEGLNAKTEGYRRGELILWTSGSGMGKTEILGQCYYHELKQYPDAVLGLIHLEEKIERTCDRLIGLHLGKRVHLEKVRETVDPTDYRTAYEATVGCGRVFLYDHFGSTEDENLCNKIRYLAKGCGCTTIVLDHISIVVSGMEEGDERRIIDNLMTKLATMAQELNVVIHVISHLKKVDGTPHEEGGRVTLDHLRGSGALKQLIFTGIALERNQQDPVKKSWTRVRVLKCRHTGDTGHACWLYYPPETGVLVEATPPFDDEESSASEFGFKDETPPQEETADAGTTDKDF